MKKILFFIFVVFSLAATLSGCVAIMVGSAIGAAGGYVVSKDTIQGDTDKPYDTLWSAAKTIASERGAIKEENYTKGTIKFINGDSSIVWIRLSRMTRATTRLKVSCRRFHLPKLELAEELFTQIMDAAK